MSPCRDAVAVDPLYVTSHSQKAASLRPKGALTETNGGKSLDGSGFVRKNVRVTSVYPARSSSRYARGLF